MRQSEVIATCRDEGVLDPRIPVAVPLMVRQEGGPTIIEYFGRKHARGEFGMYWLHQVKLM